MITGAAAFVGCTYNEMTSPYGELNIIFDTEKVVLNAGESIELPFTVTGTDGAALDFEPSSDNSKLKCRLSKVDYDNAQGVILVSASKTISSDLEAQVFLKVSDSHHRKLTRFVDVSVIGNGGSGGEDPGDDGDNKGDDQYGDLASSSTSPHRRSIRDRLWRFLSPSPAPRARLLTLYLPWTIMNMSAR